ncbi:MAG: hypothetical protein GC164_10125 [Phycisphaera sp.]|nr:hypothetical protein [Phycisphaera sp.]
MFVRASIGAVLGVGVVLTTHSVCAEEPTLPEGLDIPAVTTPPDAPDLPEGLGGGTEPTQPAAPPAMAKDKLPFDLSGFFEVRIGPYTQSAPGQRNVAVAESRLQLQVDKTWHKVAFRLTGDFLLDAVPYSNAIDPELGQGWIDLREAYVSFSPIDFVDIKAGRQVLTWGTGDLLFLNDLFPKDWNSFLIGRDTEYLKAPSDAVKVSLFSDIVNIDMVYTPAFDADRFVDGRRVSYFNPMVGSTVGRSTVRFVDRPQHTFSDDEFAARLYRRLGAWELAGYLYLGYWKSPTGTDPMTGRGTFPGLNVYGASIRGPLAEGIFNAELAFYDSRDDRGGSNPFVNNDELRFLVGFEREVAPDFTVGLQYYLEQMLDHNDYRATLPVGVPRRDELRHVVTARFTLMTMMQNLEWSLFVFYSPSDNDAYLRPRVHYKVSDHWSAEIGANVLIGANETTFFGQFRDMSNVYVAARYSF